MINRTSVLEWALRIFLIGLAPSCANYNSNTYDASTYQNATLDTSDPGFLSAFPIIQSKCISCHTNNYHAPWSALNSNEKWIASGLVIKNDPSQSYFIQRLKNYQPSGDMPLDGDLSASDYTILLNWIQNMP